MALSQPTKDYDGGGNMSRSVSSSDGLLPSLSRQDTPLSLDYYYSGSAGMGSSSTSSLSTGFNPSHFENQSHIASSTPKLPLQAPPSHHLSSSSSKPASPSYASPSFFVGGGPSSSSRSVGNRSPNLNAPSPPSSPKPSFFSSNGGVKQPKRTDSFGAKGKALSGWMMRKGSTRKGGSGESLNDLEKAEQRKQDKSAATTSALPPRLPTETFDSDDASSGEDGVVDISWARKMVEEMEADGSSSSDGGPAMGAGSSRGDLADLDSEEDDETGGRRFPPRPSSSSSGSSFYNGTPSSANPPFELPSPSRTTYSSSQASPQEPLSPSQDSEITPRLAQFSHSNPPSPSNSSTHTTTTESHLRHPPGSPFSPGNGSSNRRIAVMEASPGPSPSTSSSSFSDHTPPPARRMSISPVAKEQPNASNLAERRGLSASRLAFVAPPDASRRSIGELREAMDEYGIKPPRRESAELARGGRSAPAGRTNFDREKESGVVNLDEDPDDEPLRSGSRSAGLTPEPPTTTADLSTVDEDTDDPDGTSPRRPSLQSHLREPGTSSPALQAARERARKARSVHLATLQSFTPPPTDPTSPASSPSSSSRPVLSADTSSAAFLKATSGGDSPMDSGLWTPAIGEGKELGVGVAGPQMLGMGGWSGRGGAGSGGGEGTGVERPRKSDMRPARTPSPTKAKLPPVNQPSDATVTRSTSQHIREPATNRPGRTSPSLPLDTLNQSTTPLPPPSSNAALDASTSGSSISNAQTLEELTAAVDRAINDAEIKESLALRSDLDFRGAKGSIPASLRAERIEEDVALDLDYVMVEQQPRASEPPRTLPKPAKPVLDRKSSSTPPSDVATVGPQEDSFPSQPSYQPSPPLDSNAPVVRRTTSLASLQPPSRPPLNPYSSNLPPRSSSSMAAPNQSTASSHYSGSGPPTPAVAPAFAIGQDRPWPAAMVFSDIRVLRTPGERANAYARKLAELGRSDTGLGDWVKASSGFKDNEPLRSSISSPPLHQPHPSSRPSNSLSASQGYPSNTSLYVPTSRNPSTSSAISEEAFPLRAGHQTQAQHLRNVSPPSGPPANLPFPQLAVGLGMRSSTSSASVRSGSVGGGGGFLQALGRRGSTSGRDRPKMGKGSTSKSPPTTLSGLPGGVGMSSGGSGARSGGRSSAESPRRMEISSPIGWTKGGGGPDGSVAVPVSSIPVGGGGGPTRTTTISGPAGPRDRNPSLPTTNSTTTLASSTGTVRRASDMDLPSYPPPPPPQSMRSSLSTHPEVVAPPSRVVEVVKDAELREMVELLEEDEKVLAEYLRREGSYMAAIGAYLDDQKRGTILRV